MGESLTKRSKRRPERPRNKPQSQEAGTLPRKARKVRRKTPPRAPTGAGDAALTDKIVVISLDKCRAVDLRGVSGHPAAHGPGGEGVGSRGKVTKGLQERCSRSAPAISSKNECGEREVCEQMQDSPSNA